MSPPDHGPAADDGERAMSYRPSVQQPVWVRIGDRRAVGLLDLWRLPAGADAWEGRVLFLGDSDGRWAPTTAWFPAAAIFLDLTSPRATAPGPRPVDDSSPSGRGRMPHGV